LAGTITSPTVSPRCCARPLCCRWPAPTAASRLDRPATIGQRYNLCGPREYTLREIVEYLARELDLKRTIIGLGPTLSKLQAAILQHLPGKPFTLDNFRSLQTDSVCPEGDAVLREVFGIEPAPLEAVVPLYLRPDTLREHYTRWRRTARRP